MRKPAMYFLMLLFAMQAAALSAQTREKPAPQFTLAISEWRQGGLHLHAVAILVI